MTTDDPEGAVGTGAHLGHVHLKVRDLDRAVAFYREAFGLAVTERVDGYAFLSFGEHHHDVALQAVDGPGDAGDATRDPTDDGVGLYHAAVEVPSAEALSTVYDRLREEGVAVTPVDHGISRALYFEDPAGNGLEAYLDTRDAPDEEWGGTNERFDPTDPAPDAGK